MQLSYRGLASPQAAFWWIAVLAAPPIAWALVLNRLGIPIGEPWRDLAFLALWSVIEEIVFRGGVQAALLHRTRRGERTLSTANVLASVLFAAAHAWSHPLVVALGLFPVSLVLGAAFERSGRRLGPPIVLHVYFNAVLYAASFVAR